MMLAAGNDEANVKPGGLLYTSLLAAGVKVGVLLLLLAWALPSPIFCGMSRMPPLCLFYRCHLGCAMVVG